MYDLQALEAWAAKYPSLIPLGNDVLTFGVLIATSFYVVLTRKMLKEMAMAAKREVLPVLAYKVDSFKIEKSIIANDCNHITWNVIGHNTGRGAAFGLTIECLLRYKDENNELSWYPTRSKNLPLSLKQEEFVANFESELPTKRMTIVCDSDIEPTFLVCIYWSDADGHNYKFEQSYRVNGYRMKMPREGDDYIYYSVCGVYYTPIHIKILRFLFLMKPVSNLLHDSSADNLKTIPNRRCDIQELGR